MIGFWWLETHLRRGLPKGEFSQVASSGGMTSHCESECSAKTKLSTGSSTPALATRSALRERKDMAFTTPPYTVEGRVRGEVGMETMSGEINTELKRSGRERSKNINR